MKWLNEWLSRQLKEDREDWEKLSRRLLALEGRVAAAEKFLMEVETKQEKLARIDRERALKERGIPEPLWDEKHRPFDIAEVILATAESDNYWMVVRRVLEGYVLYQYDGYEIRSCGQGRTIWEMLGYAPHWASVIVAGLLQGKGLKRGTWEEENLNKPAKEE